MAASTQALITLGSPFGSASSPEPSEQPQQPEQSEQSEQYSLTNIDASPRMEQG
jgi:hypothetical protein